MNVCKECGFSNGMNSKFCSNCGTKLEKTSVEMQPVYEQIEAEILNENSVSAAEPEVSVSEAVPAAEEVVEAPVTETATAFAVPETGTKTDSFWGSSSATNEDSFWSNTSTESSKREESFWNGTSADEKKDSFWETPVAVPQADSVWGTSEPKGGDDFWGNNAKQDNNDFWGNGTDKEESVVNSQPEIDIRYDAEDTAQTTATSGGYQESGQQYYGTTSQAMSGQSAVQGTGGMVGISVAGMVSGILSLLCCCFPYFSMLLGIAALVLGFISLKNRYDGKGMAIAGMVCGGIGTFLAILFIIANNFSDVLFEGLEDILGF